MIDLPCKCSHPKSKHTGVESIAEPFLHGFCGGCYNSRGEDSSFHAFKLDNLRYLELMSEQKEAEC